MHTIKKVRVALLRNAVAKEMAHLGYADPRQRRTRSTDPREKTEKQKEERVTRWTVLATKTKKLLILPLAPPVYALPLLSTGTANYLPIIKPVLFRGSSTYS